WSGGEIEDASRAVGFGDPVLDFPVVGGEVMQRGNHGDGVYSEREVLERGSVRTVDEAAGLEVKLGVVGSERPGKGGIEFIHKAKNSIMIHGGTLAEETARVETDLSVNRANGVGLVRFTPVKEGSDGMSCTLGHGVRLGKMEFLAEEVVVVKQHPDKEPIIWFVKLRLNQIASHLRLDCQRKKVAGIWGNLERPLLYIKPKEE
ncbi:MAG: hypothetical protein Q9177_000329, partial [Variospora cf. flavescens]